MEEHRTAASVHPSSFNTHAFAGFSDFDDFERVFTDEMFVSEDFGKEQEDFDASAHLENSLYCRLIESYDTDCSATSLAEMWNFDENIIKTLTKDDILIALNTTKQSPVFGGPMDYMNLLGNVRRNESGHVVAASAALAMWVAHVNETLLKEDLSAGGNDAGTDYPADEFTLKWEMEFLDAMEKLSHSLVNMKMTYTAGRSYGDISKDAIFGEMKMMVGCVLIMFLYVIFMLGKPNMVEMRIYLAMVGLSCIGMAVLVAYGLCSVVGVFYGPVHTALPFLLLGIGIDDMFVIVQCWNNLSMGDKRRPLNERLGLTLKHAGVSITITSVTDFAAFMVGATTVLPSLKSFCIYAGVGVLATYVFQATFFVAWFSLDQRRIESSRNGILCCIRHETYKPNKCSQRDIGQVFFNKIYSKFLFKTPVKVFVILVALGVVGFNIKGNMQLQQKFDPVWFLPPSSHMYHFLLDKQEFYPHAGESLSVFIGQLNYSAELPKIDRLVSSLREQDVVTELVSWFDSFKEYMKHYFQIDISSDELSEEQFNYYLSKFLFSSSGSQFQFNFRVKGNLTCGQPVPPILLSSFDLVLRPMSGPEEHLPAMHRLKNLLKSMNFSTGDRYTALWARCFANWETDEVIDEELYRNLALAMVCVLFTTLILISNLPTCLMVLFCVLLTLIDVGGMLFYWGMTIDVVSCIGLVLAVGLCVDYAAHIGHTFMTCTGTRNERAIQTVCEIGPAVFNGGFSTLLAFVLLGGSDSHVFKSFFKIFVLVVVFGLFHGLVFLPVVLSLIGPAPYKTSVPDIPMVPMSRPHTQPSPHLYKVCLKMPEEPR